MSKLINEGWIAYTPKGIRKSFVETVEHIEYFCGDLHIWVKTDLGPSESFIYKQNKDIWLVSKLKDYKPGEEVEWEEFKGIILGFEYKTKLIDEDK